MGGGGGELSSRFRVQNHTLTSRGRMRESQFSNRLAATIKFADVHVKTDHKIGRNILYRKTQLDFLKQ